MNYLDNHTEEQLQTALDVATLESAIELWQMKDWTTYSNARDALVAMIRAGRGAEVRIPQLRFIYFVNTHLLRRFSKWMPDARMFLADLPPLHETACRSCGALTSTGALT